MAFTVEDGTGVVGANSLASVAFVDAYFTERGITTWVGATEVKQQKLVQATDYFEQRFGLRLKSYMVAEDQALSFPRVDYVGVPDKIKKCVSEYALRALIAPLLPDPTVDVTGRSVKRSRKELGPLKKDIEYTDSGRVAVFKPYPQADNYVAEFLIYNNRVIR